MENNAGWDHNDEIIARRMLTSVDDQTVEWAQKKTKDFFYLLTQYKCAMMELETRFNLLNEEHLLECGHAPISSIKTRLKTIQSIKEKMERRGYTLTSDSVKEHLHDIAGVRVICPFQEDVYTLSDALLRQDDITLIRRKDYIQNPKENGYRSLHMIVAVPIYLAHEKRQVEVEVQLRTIAMDCWASLEHQLRYKSNAEFTGAMADELYQCAKLSAELDHRMNALRKRIHSSGQSVETDHNLNYIAKEEF